MILNDQDLVIHAATAGVGLGFVFEATAAPAVARGELVTVLDDWCPFFPGFFLYYPTRCQMRPALRAFINFFTAGEVRSGGPERTTEERHLTPRAAPGRPHETSPR